MPKPGHHLVELENPSYENSVIFAYRGSEVIDIIPVNDETLEMYKPKKPPQFYEAEHVMGEITLDRPLEEGYFVNRINPFVQAIWMTVRQMGSATWQDIFRSLTSQWRIAPNTPEYEEMVKGYIRRMHAQALLRRVEGGKLAVGIVPRGGAFLIPHKPGFDPIEDQIVWFVSAKGMARLDEIVSYIVSHLEWLRRGDSAEWYVARLVRRRHLKEIRKGWYAPERPLEPFK
jgi:hypothetical protein